MVIWGRVDNKMSYHHTLPTSPKVGLVRTRKILSRHYSKSKNTSHVCLVSFRNLYTHKLAAIHHFTIEANNCLLSLFKPKTGLLTRFRQLSIGHKFTSSTQFACVRYKYFKATWNSCSLGSISKLIIILWKLPMKQSNQFTVLSVATDLLSLRQSRASQFWKGKHQLWNHFYLTLLLRTVPALKMCIFTTTITVISKITTSAESNKFTLSFWIIMCTTRNVVKNAQWHLQPIIITGMQPQTTQALQSCFGLQYTQVCTSMYILWACYMHWC